MGIIVGGLLSSKFVVVGRRVTAIFSILISFVGVALMVIWVNLISICIGRFVYAFACGILITCANLWLSETVPKENMGPFSVTVNLGIVLGFMVCLYGGLPLVSMDEAQAK